VPILRRSAVVAALVASAAVPAGCGGQRDGPPAAGAAAATAEPVGDVSGGSVAQFADCGDWRAGSPAERRATVRVLRGQLTPQRSKTAASPLRDERAYAIFEKACAQEFAESLRLYKLYVKVQGFAPLSG
jgi:hypothetical protein